MDLKIEVGKYYEFVNSTKETWIVTCRAIEPGPALWNNDKPIYYLEFFPQKSAPRYSSGIVRFTPKDIDRIIAGGVMVEIDEKSDKYKAKVAKLLLRRNSM